MTSREGERDARFEFGEWDPERLRETLAALRTEKTGRRVSVTIELDADTVALLMLTGKDWIQRFRRLEAAAWQREIRPHTEADVLPFEVGRRLTLDVEETRHALRGNPWVAVMLAAAGRAGDD